MKVGEELFNVDDGVEYNCKRCKDKGVILENGRPVKCPECSVGTKKVLLGEDEVEKRIEGIIPEKYRGIIFEPDKLKNSSMIEKHIKDNPEFDYYIEMITALYNKINAGEVLPYSLIIMAPQNLGKTHLVYACLNAAVRCGKTIAPYLDTLEIYDLIARGGREDKEVLGLIEGADVCFMKLPAGLTTNVMSTQTLKLMVDRRARKGLASIVTSRFPIKYIYSAEVNLDRFIITSNYGSEKFDYSRLRVIQSPFPDLRVYFNKYMRKR